MFSLFVYSYFIPIGIHITAMITIIANFLMFSLFVFLYFITINSHITKLITIDLWKAFCQGVSLLLAAPGCMHIEWHIHMGKFSKGFCL